VYRGNDEGLVVSPPSDFFFGKDSFGDLGDKLPFDSSWLSKVQKEHASVFLARIVKENPGKVRKISRKIASDIFSSNISRCF
jgi:hypothetical protein